MKILKRIALPAGLIVGLFTLGFGLAYAGGLLTVSFGAGVGIEGNIHVDAPDPAADDLSITVPEINLKAGTSTTANYIITVTNNSQWDLTCQDITIDFPPEIGTMGLADSVKDVALSKGGTQNIVLYLQTRGDIVKGDYTYTGIISYSW